MSLSETALSLLDSAIAEGKIKDENAIANVRKWITQPEYEKYLQPIIDHMNQGKFDQLKDVFWQEIPFGTGGRRGRMYPFGCNAINERTIGESAQGLADFIIEAHGEKPRRCAIAYDPRHRSREFAELCAGIMAEAGFDVFFLDDYRSTPELSFTVRMKDCSCGIMVTASHNPPSDNAVKVYGYTGGQMIPPDDEDSIERMKAVREIHSMSFREAKDAGKIHICTEAVDQAFVDAVLQQSLPGPRDLRIIYSPLHGVGGSIVPEVLRATGFADVELFGPHAKPDPEFPNVPGHVSNPENPRVFDMIIERARETGAELILATDPDCDRLGCAVPVTGDPAGEWTTLTGNQIAVLLTDHLLGHMQREGTLVKDEHFVVKTLVTTELMTLVAKSYGAKMVGDLHVGFKWIGAAIDEYGPERFVFGAEESYGFLTGTHVRDKDGPVASLVLSEYAARLKSQGMSLAQKLDELFARFGCHSESQFSLVKPGASGMDDMKALMARFRSDPPTEIAGLKYTRVDDYLTLKGIDPTGARVDLPGTEGDLVIIQLEGTGNRVAVRPSGTEPKVKFYMFAAEGPCAPSELEAVKASQAERLAAMQRDLQAYAGE